MATRKGYHHYQVTKKIIHQNGEIETFSSEFTAKDGRTYLDRERKTYLKLGWKDFQYKNLVELD